MIELGWDAVFEFEGQTYAEMDKTEKVSEVPCPPIPLPHPPAGPSLCRPSVILTPALSHINGPLGGLLTLRQALTEFTQQNQISHRGKALTKLKSWLAGGDLEQ